MKILNASPQFGKPLNEQEIKNFLSTKVLNVHLGTMEEDCHPNVHPVWYYYDSTNNRLYIETSKSSKKLANLRKNNRVYFCIDEPNFPYKGIKGKGICKIHEEIPHNINIAEKIMIRYLGSLDHPMAQSLMGFVKKGDSVILEICPLYFSTWDYNT